MRVLLVEDDPELAAIIASGLSEPFLMCGVMIATFSNIIGTRPESRSGSSAPLPL